MKLEDHLPPHNRVSYISFLMSPNPCLTSHNSSLTSCLTSHVFCQSHVSCLSYVSCLTFPVPRLLSQISCLKSHVSNLLFHVSCLRSPVSRLLSHSSCLTSPVACLLSSTPSPTYRQEKGWRLTARRRDKGLPLGERMKVDRQEKG